jgi:flagellar hook-length control protein FliK
MLASKNVTQSVLPFESILKEKVGQVLPDGAKFSELFSSMFSEAVSDTELVADVNQPTTQLIGHFLDQESSLTEASLPAMPSTNAEILSVKAVEVNDFSNDTITALSDTVKGALPIDITQLVQGTLASNTPIDNKPAANLPPVVTYEMALNNVTKSVTPDDVVEVVDEVLGLNIVQQTTPTLEMSETSEIVNNNFVKNNPLDISQVTSNLLSNTKGENALASELTRSTQSVMSVLDRAKEDSEKVDMSYDASPVLIDYETYNSQTPELTQQSDKALDELETPVERVLNVSSTEHISMASTEYIPMASISEGALEEKQTVHSQVVKIVKEVFESKPLATPSEIVTALKEIIPQQAQEQILHGLNKKIEVDLNTDKEASFSVKRPVFFASNNTLNPTDQTTTLNEEMTKEPIVPERVLNATEFQATEDSGLPGLNFAQTTQNVEPLNTDLPDEEASLLFSEDDLTNTLDEKKLTNELAVQQSQEVVIEKTATQVSSNEVINQQILDDSDLANPAIIANENANVSQIAQAATVTPNNARTNNVSQNSASVDNYATQWGASAEKLAGSQGFSQSGQQSSQGSAGQHASQQYMMNAQVPNEVKQQALEQQFNVKATEELLAKTETRDSLLGGELTVSDRKLQLPLGLQSIQVPVKHPQWGQALGQRIVFMANNQLQQAQITLNPEKLGPVQIKLHMDKDQQVHVTMVAQNTTTREAMESAIPRLKDMLEQSGLDLASVDVGDDKQFAENESSESGQSDVHRHESDQESESQENMAPLQVAATDNIVDFYA